MSSVYAGRSYIAAALFTALFAGVNVGNAQAAELKLTLRGTAGTGAATELLPAAGRLGQIDFGRINTTIGRQPRGKGKRVRVTRGRPGSHFVATLIASVSINGVGTETATISVTQTGGSLPLGRLRYALHDNNTWTAEGAGQPILETPTVMATGVTSGENVVHQVAVFVLDSDLAGSHNLGITYVAMAL